ILGVGKTKFEDQGWRFLDCLHSKEILSLKLENHKDRKTSPDRLDGTVCAFIYIAFPPVERKLKFIRKAHKTNHSTFS
ncbi:hypothetical protein LSTR_LSTR001461, partial [Laodelphax striatellus]